MPQQRIVLVTGANRGLGKATATAMARQGDFVYFAARDLDAARQAANAAGMPDNTAPLALDVSSAASIQEAIAEIQNAKGRLDVLINNAGVLLDEGWQSEGSSSMFDAQIQTIRDTAEVNVYGILLLLQQVVPLMQSHDYGRIVNVSSGMGQLSDMEGGFIAYRLSKAGVNVLTRAAAAELGQDSPIKINAICPGWVRTDMGGKEAVRSLEEGIAGTLWAANLPDDGPTGGFFRDGERLDW